VIRPEQGIDPFFDSSDLDEMLFASYQDIVLEIAVRPDPTVEDIQTAAEYSRAALALFPQSLEYARQRAELQEVAIDLLASQYYLRGISMLESSDYSIQGLEQPILVLKRASEMAPGSPVADSAIQKVELFVDAYGSLVHGGWDGAIAGFEDLYGRDPDFADGRVRYFLYEAYTRRGDLLMLNADFGGALSDYQAAEKYAWMDDENVLRIFQIELRVGGALRKLGQYDQAAEYYHFAFDHVAYTDRLTKPDQAKLRETVLNADWAYAGDNAFSALSYYEEAAQQADEFFELIRIAVLQGDTLPNIAFANGSTLSSLQSANELGDRLVVGRSTELLIPILPPLQG
jgi:tetratricopeptide (TPR) repeat protein